MAVITISEGGKEGAFRGDPGVYTATLITHELVGPFDAKQPKYPGEKYHLFEWGFSIDEAPEGAEMVWMTSGASSSGPKSKTFGIITALAGGREPQAGVAIDTDKLLGRQVLIDVRRNEKGYLDAVGIMPLPSKGAKPAAKPAVAEADPDDSLPF